MYKTICSKVIFEQEIKKSRFIAYVVNVESESEAQNIIAKSKILWPNARHYCYAYILRQPTFIERYSDDGEPSGTAGLPILDILRHKNLENIVAIVVRYFGGILLGTGGLVKAYSETVKLAVENTEIIHLHIATKLLVQMDYNIVGKIENECIKFGVYIDNKEYSDKVIYKIYVLQEEAENFKTILVDKTNGNINIDGLGSEFMDINIIKASNY